MGVQILCFFKINLFWSVFLMVFLLQVDISALCVDK